MPIKAKITDFGFSKLILDTVNDDGELDSSSRHPSRYYSNKMYNPPES